MKHTIYLGGGCFWCIEAVFQRIQGVISVVSGYMGGSVDNPTYEQVCQGNTGHVEVVRVEFNSDRVSLEKILETFWSVHNPTTLNRQGNDMGTQYRSGIYYTDQSQLPVIQGNIQAEQTNWSDPIITEIQSATTFYQAESYHQDYFNQHSWQPYCQLVIRPKIDKLKN
jgi:peptide-methionine (S)-S-oxide reductase